jgi:serine/threonine protein kinase
LLRNENSATLYFANENSYNKWSKALIEACGDYKLSDFYEEHHDIVLGKGSRALVYLGVNKKQKIQVAIKRISAKDVNTEVQIMKLGVHHYVSRLVDYFSDPIYSYLVLELESGGTLLQYISEHNNYIPESRCKSIA